MLSFSPICPHGWTLLCSDHSTELYGKPCRGQTTHWFIYQRPRRRLRFIAEGACSSVALLSLGGTLNSYNYWILTRILPKKISSQQLVDGVSSVPVSDSRRPNPFHSPSSKLQGGQTEAPGFISVCSEETKPKFVANSLLFSSSGYSFQYKKEFAPVIFKALSSSKV